MSTQRTYTDNELSITSNSGDSGVKGASRGQQDLDPFSGTDDFDVPDDVLKHKYFVKTETSMLAALQELDRRMRANNDYHLITRKRPHSLFGRRVEAGQLGLMSYSGRPIICTRPGNYWNFSPTHTWAPANMDITEVNHYQGLTFAQVGQSEAMVVMDANNRVFVIRNGGFCAYGESGRFKVIEIVDTLNLGSDSIIMEEDGERILGWKREVHFQVMNTKVVIATFFNVPAQNCVIIQNGNHLRLLPSGQHVITNPHATFRGFFTTGERQRQMRTAPAYTIEGVPVVLDVVLRYRVYDPLKLTVSYAHAYQALANPAQSAVNAVVSRLSYQQFMKAKKVAGDIPDADHVPWLLAFKEECLSELSAQAELYGIKVEAFDVLDRHLEGKLGADLEKQAESVLRNQMMATQVHLQNQINHETQKGKLQIVQVEAEQTRTIADAEYYTQVKKTDANAENIRREARARADALEIETAQNVRTIKAIAEAQAIAVQFEGQGYASVVSEHGKRMQLENVEVNKFKSLPKETTFFAGGGSDFGKVTEGFNFGKGMVLSGRS